MKEPIWIELREVLAAHSEQLAAHGGTDGVRDQTLLESALAKPLNVFAYGDPDIFDLAASYAFGIARNHAFIDGNKRTAASISMGFLLINGWDIEAPKEEEYFSFLRLAEGAFSEEEMAAWFRTHAVELGS
jgi:death-on-curing protein